MSVIIANYMESIGFFPAVTFLLDAPLDEDGQIAQFNTQEDAREELYASGLTEENLNNLIDDGLIKFISPDHPDWPDELKEAVCRNK